MLLADVTPADVIGDALRLHLGRTVWPAVAHEVVPVPGVAQVMLEVLAASHRVTVLAPDGNPDHEWLVETVACGTADAPPVSADHLPSSHESVGGHGTYRFRSRTDHGDDAVRRAATAVRAMPRGLAVAFPGHPDALTGLAVSPVEATGPSGAGGVAWSTWHVYPGATPHVVTTSSTFSLHRRSR